MQGISGPLQFSPMDQSLRAIEDVKNALFNKDIELLELRKVNTHQAQLLAKKHAEIDELKKKIDELRGFAATWQGRVYDQAAELAALKCKSVEFAGTQTDIVGGQDMQVQTDIVGGQDMQVQTEELLQAGTREIETQTITGYVAYATDKTDEFLLQAHEAHYALCREIRQVQSELAELDSVLDDEIVSCETERAVHAMQMVKMQLLPISLAMPAQEATPFDVEPVLEQAFAQEVVPDVQDETTNTNSTGKKGSSKNKKMTPEEKAAKQQQKAAEAEAKRLAELEAHKEAARANRERERIAKIQKKAELLARVQTARAEETQATPVQAKKVQAVPATARPLPMSASVLSAAKVDVAEKAGLGVAETFAMRSNDARDLLIEEDVPAILGLYVLECFGESSWKLEQADKKFRLVLRREYPKTGKVITKASPFVSGKDIVFWIERPEFVTATKAVFEFRPFLADELMANTIANAFERIRKSSAFQTLRLRVSARKDAFGLSMRQITLKDGSAMSFSLVKLIIWFYMGKIEAMAGTSSPQSCLAAVIHEFMFE